MLPDGSIYPFSFSIDASYFAGWLRDIWRPRTAESPANLLQQPRCEVPPPNFERVPAPGNFVPLLDPLAR